MGSQGAYGRGYDGVIRELRADPGCVERVTSRDEVWACPIFEVDDCVVELPDGTSAGRQLVMHNGGAAVVALREGSVCLVRQYRVALGRMTLEVPAGKVEPGEDPASTAARELAEETGLVAGRLTHLVTLLGSPGFTNEKTEVYLAEGLEQTAADPDEGEFVRAVWLPVDEVVAAIRAGVIQDGKTVAGVMAGIA